MDLKRWTWSLEGSQTLCSVFELSGKNSTYILKPRSKANGYVLISISLNPVAPVVQEFVRCRRQCHFRIIQGTVYYRELHVQYHGGDVSRTKGSSPTERGCGEALAEPNRMGGTLWRPRGVLGSYNPGSGHAVRWVFLDMPGQRGNSKSVGPENGGEESHITISPLKSMPEKCLDMSNIAGSLSC